MILLPLARWQPVITAVARLYLGPRSMVYELDEVRGEPQRILAAADYDVKRNVLFGAADYFNPSD
jgi:hypothetical protein